MAATSSSQAIFLANGIISAIGTLSDLAKTAASLSAQSTHVSLSATLAAMATCLANADGTLGTEDETPSTDAGHVIDTRVTTQSGLARATIAYDLGYALNILQELNNLCQGNAVSTMAGAPDIIAKLVGG